LSLRLLLLPLLRLPWLLRPLVPLLLLLTRTPQAVCPRAATVVAMLRHR